MRPLKLCLLLFLVPVLAVLNIIVGSVNIPLSSIADVLLNGSCDSMVWTSIILKTRLPQTITALCAGAGLAVSGLQMQTVFHNPLAGPSVLGISSAASLGVAFVVLLSGAIGGGIASRFGLFGNAALTISAALGALSVMAIMVLLSQRVSGNATLLIIGVMIGYIASAITGVLKYFSSEEDIRAYVIWGLGSFARVTGGQTWVFAGILGIMLPLSMLLAKPLNLLLLGEQYAMNLGLNMQRSRMLIIASAGILVAVVTAYCGPIMFLGLAVPHICRGIFGTSDHRILLPATLFCGADLALVCNIISRLPGFEGALPVNSVTALIGAPVVIWVLLKRK